jgi:hypothetical protein
MGKGRGKQRRNAKKLGQRTRQEEEIVRAFEAKGEEFRRRLALEAKDTDVIAELQKRTRERSAGRELSDPPVFGGPDPLVRAPLRPRPNLRSGGIAIQEPESQIEFVVLKPRSI